MDSHDPFSDVKRDVKCTQGTTVSIDLSQTNRVTTSRTLWSYVRLAFEDEGLEGRFLAYYSSAYILQFRFAVLLGLVLVTADASVDFMASAERALWGNVVRLIGFIPIAVLSLLLSFQPAVRKRLQLFASLTVLATGSVILWSLVLLERAKWHGLSSWVGLLNFTFLEIFIFVIIGLQFKNAVAPGLSVFLAYLCLLYLVAGFAPSMLVYYGYHLITLVMLAMFIGYFRERYIRTDFAKSAQLSDERERFEDMLCDIIPARIVQRLRAGERPVADAHGEVTVLLTDLVGSTALARKLAPHHFVEILNELYAEFDSLAEHCAVERIKTIGDSYMAVAGLEANARPGGAAQNALKMAQAMLVAVENIATRLGQPLKMRIGVHTGSVIAGVLGGRNYQYDLWGDAVNVASRLESTAEAGRIQVSETTYWRTQHAYEFEYRGEVEARGIGPLKAYYLIREKEQGEPVPQPTLYALREGM